MGASRCTTWLKGALFEFELDSCCDLPKLRAFGFRVRLEFWRAVELGFGCVVCRLWEGIPLGI